MLGFFLKKKNKRTEAASAARLLSVRCRGTRERTRSQLDQGAGEGSGTSSSKQPTQQGGSQDNPGTVPTTQTYLINTGFYMNTHAEDSHSLHFLPQNCLRFYIKGRRKPQLLGSASSCLLFGSGKNKESHTMSSEGPSKAKLHPCTLPSPVL